LGAGFGVGLGAGLGAGFGVGELPGRIGCIRVSGNVGNINLSVIKVPFGNDDIY
jgi:hypothetical protein